MFPGIDIFEPETFDCFQLVKPAKRPVIVPDPEEEDHSRHQQPEPLGPRIGEIIFGQLLLAVDGFLKICFIETPRGRRRTRLPQIPSLFTKDLIADILEMAVECPVIILTGYSNADFSIQSIYQGVSDYLLKDNLNAFSNSFS